MIKDNFYIITGGPGGGKTSILECLRLQGIGYIEETARQIIRARLNQGLSPRPEPLVFAEEMFKIDLSNFNSGSNGSSILFFDRSMVDSSGLIFKADKASFDHVAETLRTNRYNRKVFITPPWKEIYCQDAERDQTFEQAIQVYEWLYDWYETNGYDLVVIPKDSIEERARFIYGEITPARGYHPTKNNK